MIKCFLFLCKIHQDSQYTKDLRFGEEEFHSIKQSDIKGVSLGSQWEGSVVICWNNLYLSKKRANGTLWIDRNPRCMIVLYKYNNKSTIDHDNKLMIKIWEKSD